MLGNGVMASDGAVTLFQLAPWRFASAHQMNLRRTHRRLAVAFNRWLGNLGAAGTTPLLERFSRPVRPEPKESRWLEGLYLDRPEEWDDPYRFFRW